MDTKAAFEKWFDNEFGKSTTPEEIVVRDMVRQGWAASRSAIEIELPEEKPYKHNNYPEARAQDDGFNDALSECSTIITSHGIRIKGKTK